MYKFNDYVAGACPGDIIQTICDQINYFKNTPSLYRFAVNWNNSRNIYCFYIYFYNNAYTKCFTIFPIFYYAITSSNAHRLFLLDYKKYKKEKLTEEEMLKYINEFILNCAFVHVIKEIDKEKYYQINVNSKDESTISISFKAM